MPGHGHPHDADADPTPGAARDSTQWPKRWWNRLGTAGKILTTFGVLSLIGASVFTLWIQPRVEDVLVGESRLQVSVLMPGEFTIQGLAHSGIWLFPSGGVEPSEVPSELLHWSRRDAFNTWAVEHGGVAAQTLALRLSVRARDETPVILHGLRVDVVERERQLDGWLAQPELGCGGQPVRKLYIDLEEDPVVPQRQTKDGTFAPFDVTLRVSNNDPEVYEIHASSLSRYVEFRLTLLYDSESGIGEYPVQDGRIFRVTGVPPETEAWSFPGYSEKPATDAALERDRSLDGGQFGC